MTKISIPDCLCIYLLSLVLFMLCGTCQADPWGDTEAPKREFRAVWVATFHNIDWPSQKGLPSDQQQREWLELLDHVQTMGMNAVILQVRPCGDAFYDSPYEPWSEYLSGKQGQAPKPYYDPLAFMLQAAHDRGIEFHAWINPFRGVSHARFSDVCDEHTSRQRPGWFLRYGPGLWFNPGLPAVRRHVHRVVLDIVSRYDIDGIHMDDYFYPYPKHGRLDDYDTYMAHGEAFESIQGWRRDNIDRFIAVLSDSIKAVKPRVKLGVSPSAVWRNKDKDPRGSDTQVPFTAYDMLYADVRKWLEQGWIDYVAPQCYYGKDNPKASYHELVNWWSQNRFGRHLYIGQAAYKVKEGRYPAWRRSDQLPEQLYINRELGVNGSIFFSMRSLRGNPRGLTHRLQHEFYAAPALLPAMTWKDSIPPLAPRALSITTDEEGICLHWEAPDTADDGERAAYFAVYRHLEDSHAGLRQELISISRNRFYIDPAAGRYGSSAHYSVTACDRLHNESEACHISFQRDIQVEAKK